MSPETLSAQPAVSARSARLGHLFRWAARLTSLPILALVVLSFIPAMLSFAVAPREDRLLAGALGGTCLGLVAGWRWAGAGGVLILASVAVMLLAGDGSPDPFSIAFGLQGVLFLLSWALNLAPGGSRASGPVWLRRTAVGLLAGGAVLGVAMICRGPGPAPLERDKQPFVGSWDSGTGFKLEITEEGRIRVTQDKEAKVQPWNTPVAAGETKVFDLNFRGDDRLELSTGGFGVRLTYHVDRPPHREGRRETMILNASDPYQRQAGIRLVKQSGADSGGRSPDAKARK